MGVNCIILTTFLKVFKLKQIFFLIFKKKTSEGRKRGRDDGKEEGRKKERKEGRKETLIQNFRVLINRRVPNSGSRILPRGDIVPKGANICFWE